MDTVRKACIWAENCAALGYSCRGCEDYTPPDTEEVDAAYYRIILEENVRIYDELAGEFADGDREDR